MEEEQGRVEVLDHHDHDEGRFRSNPAWWRDSRMLVRWAFTVLVAMAYFDQIKKWRWSLQVTIFVTLYFFYFKFKNQDVSTLGTLSAMEAYNALKLFLRRQPEFHIWNNITRLFVPGLIVIKGPNFLMGTLLVTTYFLMGVLLVATYYFMASLSSSAHRMRISFSF